MNLIEAARFTLAGEFISWRLFLQSDGTWQATGQHLAGIGLYAIDKSPVDATLGLVASLVFLHDEEN